MRFIFLFLLASSVATITAAEPVGQLSHEKSFSKLSITDLGTLILGDRLTRESIIVRFLNDPTPYPVSLDSETAGVYVLENSFQLVIVKTNGEVLTKNLSDGVEQRLLNLPIGAAPISVLNDSSGKTWVLDTSGVAFASATGPQDATLKSQTLTATPVRQITALGDGRYIVLTDAELRLVERAENGFETKSLLTPASGVRRIVGVSDAKAKTIYMSEVGGMLNKLSGSSLSPTDFNIDGAVFDVSVGGNSLITGTRDGTINMVPVEDAGSNGVLLFSDSNLLSSDQRMVASENGRFVALTEDGVTNVFDLWATPNALLDLAKNRAFELINKLSDQAATFGNGHQYEDLCTSFLSNPGISDGLAKLAKDVQISFEELMPMFARRFDELCNTSRSIAPSENERGLLEDLRQLDTLSNEEFRTLAQIEGSSWAQNSFRSREKYLLDVAQQAYEEIRDTGEYLLLRKLVTEMIVRPPSESYALETLQLYSALETLDLYSLELGTATDKSNFPASGSTLDVVRKSIELEAQRLRTAPRPLVLHGQSQRSITQSVDDSAGLGAAGNSSTVLVPRAADTGASLSATAPPSPSLIPLSPGTSQIPSKQPTRSVDDFLPRDGLYVRRNNQYGSESPQISEALKRGVLVGQEVITFDDFVGIELRGLPDLVQDQLISISTGVSKIPESLRRDDKATHYVEIVLRSRKEQPTDTLNIGTDANYVFVVDRSGSMSDEIDMARKTIFKLYEDLRDQDSIGIVAFNDGVSTVLEAKKKANLDRQTLASLLNTLTVNGGTDINLGLGYGFDEFLRFDALDRGNQLILLSDGEPSSGVTDWFAIRRNVAASMRDSRAQITAFAIGAGANFDELDSLVGSSGGRAEAILSVSDIDGVLSEEALRQRNAAAMDIQLQLTLAEPVSLRYFYGHEPITDPARKQDIIDQQKAVAAVAASGTGGVAQDSILAEEKGLKVFVPNLSFGEAYILLLEVALPDGVDKVLDLNAQYIDVPGRKAVQVGPTTVARDSNDIIAESSAVRAFKLASSEIVFSALSDMREGNRNGAIEKIQLHSDRLRVAAEDLSDVSLNNDRVTLRKFVRLIQNVGTTRIDSDFNHQGRMSLIGSFGPALGQFATTNANFLRGNFLSDPN